MCLTTILSTKRKNLIFAVFNNFLGGNASSPNYQNVLNFMASLVGALSVDSANLKVKAGMVIFGSVVETIFAIGDYTDSVNARNKYVLKKLFIS